MHFDASGAIHAWDNYPIANFPAFWDWIDAEIGKDNFAISEVAFDEVKNKSPECAEWLKIKSVRKINLSETILLRANEIKDLLGIVAEAYNPKGVGENDLLIIATAEVEGAILITEESRQPALPIQRSKFKIPAVCELDEIGVSCKNIRELIATSGVVFK
jgi:predicted nucleic acid-binding protein